MNITKYLLSLQNRIAQSFFCDIHSKIAGLPLQGASADLQWDGILVLAKLDMMQAGVARRDHAIAVIQSCTAANAGHFFSGLSAVPILECKSNIDCCLPMPIAEPNSNAANLDVNV